MVNYKCIIFPAISLMTGTIILGLNVQSVMYTLTHCVLIDYTESTHYGL